MKKETKLHKNNSGMTLVEILVSLLILMIIMVPMMTAFVTSQKANKASRETLYARTVGENIMEEVKATGIDNARFVEESNGVYKVEGIVEGTESYDAVVTVSLAGEHDDVNSYQFADLTAFSKEGVAIINPMVQGSSYDNKALSYFSNMNRKLMNDRYKAACRLIDDYNRDEYSDYEEELRYNPNAEAPAMATYPPQTNYSPLTAAEVRGNIRKKIIVNIDDYADGVGNMVTGLESQLIYTCINKSDSSGNPLFSNNTTIYPTDSEVYPVEKPPYTGYCQDTRYSELQALMLIYRPFNDLNNLNKETIEINKNTTRDIKLFIAMQGTGVDFSSATTRPNLIISGTNSTGVELFSQANFNITGHVPSSDKVHRTLVTENTAGDRIYNVTVNVYEGGKTFSRVLCSIDSTMLQE